MSNVALATAVYIDPRLHHDETPRAMLGEITVDVEVILFFHMHKKLRIYEIHNFYF